MMRSTFLAVLGVALATQAVGAKERRPLATPATVKAVTDCRSIREDGARLACFDQAAVALDAAIGAKTLYVVDKAQVRETRRTLFGLPLPNLGIFGDENDDINAIKEVDGVVKSASLSYDGNWTVVLEDGSGWRQTDGTPLGKSPRKGSKIKIKRAALGSYKMNVEGQSAVRVRRQF